MKDSTARQIDRAFANPQVITRALARGVREALLQHKRAGLPIVVYQNGKTVLVPARKIKVGRQIKRRRALSKA